MKMEALAYLARSDSSDDDDGFDSSDGRPTPLDPEYWRGITHSREVVAAPSAAYRQPSRMEPPPHHYGPYGTASLPLTYHHHQQQQHQHQPYQRPATSPSAMMHGHGHYAGGGVLMSPIHYQGGPPMIPISPVAHMDAMHDANFMSPHSGVGMAHGMHRPAEWPPRSYSPGAGAAAVVSPVSTPQQLKQQVREALVRAQAYLDLGPFFQSYDMSYTGGIRLGSIQEALGRMGVILRDHVLQSIGQLFSIPGSGLIDYMSLSRFLELDAQELDNMRSMVAARRSVLVNSGVELVEAQYKGKSKFYPGVISRCRLNGTYDIDYDDGEKETGVAAELIRLLGKKGGGDSDDDPKTKKFKEGDKVEAQYKGKSKFYPGVISRCRLNGTYDIDYDDGEKETGVAAELIRLLGKKGGGDSDDDPKTKKFKEGDKVEAQYKGKSKFYPGVISRCRLNGTYDIDYDDGEKETGVAAELIRLLGKKGGGDSDDDPKTKKFKEGDKVEAQYKGKSKFYPGVISRCRLNGTYDIDYDDGEKETGVAAELIRLLGKKGGGDSDDDPKTKKFKEGDKVEAQYKGKSKFYPGVISRCRLNGTYDIDYDDGEKETGVAAELIRLLGKKGGGDSDDDPKTKKFKEGDKVEAQYKGKSKFYPGVISRCRLNGTYDIDYDDGEKETGVAAELIRLLGKKGGGDSDDDPKTKKFKEGDKVEAQYKGKSKFYPGVISRCRLNGTYDIDYDDGEKETGVAAELIRLLGKKGGGDSDDDPKTKKFKEGDKVEAQYKGKSKFYPGVISRCRLNGTYDIDYDDGEKETGVAAELIRLLGKKGGGDSDDDPKTKKFKEGDKVEAQYKGKSKFYPGVISRCRLNGTYDIDYDDGEKETGVAAELIRLLGKKGGGDSDDDPKTKKFKEGDKVEAQYKGKSKFYPGVISRCRLNGTYDIDYDDGEKETGVAAELIRLLGKKGGGDSDDDPKTKKFKEGDKVEAQYKGKSKFYPGVISRCRLNGTYDIDYDDGEKETGVAAELIRLLGKKGGGDSDDDPKTKKFKEGDKVEAQYKGKSKFYPGVISRCRLNGTYDIDYDDGEKETGVAAELIRLLGKKGGGDSDDDPKTKKFKEGDKVEAQYKGKSKFYPGVISRCRLNGTYDIDYDDGEKETGVAAELIRLLGKKGGGDSDDDPKTKKFKEGDKVEAQYKGKSKFYPGVISRCRLNGTRAAATATTTRKTKKFKEGDKVEAQYKGKSKFYPGVISRCRLNGTYDIDYDDGEKETGVAAELIRLLGKKGGGDSDDDPKTKKFKEGDKVEAQYKGKSKFYPGVISRCRLNGTYDIDYDDGEKETGVAAELIRLLGKKGGGDSDDDPKTKKFKEGDKVEAQYKGKSKFYPGVISRCRLNGTYDIDYDDGEKETGVAAELIRLLGKKGGGDSDDDPKTKKFKEGDKVEAQYKGKSKFYPGVISRCRLNGTYDIDYDDGEKETGVAAELIRLLGKKGGGDSDDDPKTKKFKEGDKVEAQYKGKSKFYPGVISRCRLNGTYDIDYDDGEKETGVAAELIRLLGKKGGGDSDDDPKTKKFKEGDKVEAQYKGKSKFYPGVISRCRLNGTYDIDYDDGEKETGVAAELIRLLGKKGGGDSDDDPKTKKFKEGDKVEAQYKGKSKFYPGVISRCRLNGTYDIDYDDGEKETGVAAELIRLLGKKGGGDSDDDPKTKKFKEGDKVEAQYKGKSKFYPGVISRCRLNGTYDIDYDDGEKETGVAAELIRLLGKKGGGDSDDDPKTKKFKEGDKVEAQYKGKSKFYPGVISRCRLNGTYDIDYDDGEKETGVAAELIRLLGKKGGGDSDDDPKTKKFKEGDKVEAQYKGKSKFYPGVISRCRLNGTYDIDYDDGEKETGVAAELIRLLGKKGGGDSDDDPKTKKFKEGDKVEAQYKGKSKFYPGVISRCRLNGTYDIDYDDGEKETGVAAELIRLLGKKGGGDSDDDPKTKKFKEGDKVEAQYKGKSKFYPGVISRCRLNGTYDIDYDDGEKETGVAAELIRLLGKKGGGDSDDDPKTKKFKEGDKVEAQYKGKSKFYPGVISRCRLNGTYDIDYDDGEKETGVAAELIRLLGKKGGGDSDDDPKTKKFKEGDKVEAQYKGKSKFYPGVISRCRLNGTYDIDYDDGEKETGVAAELIRLLGKKGGGDSDDDPKTKKFKEGDKVEAQYKGKSKFYPGVISRCRLNGTYDIDYDDGEKETGVAAELIRLLGKKGGGDSDDDPKTKKFKEGDKVEAQYKGKSKFYPGVISRCRLNGTYDIDYDDGEKETGVAAELIRLLGKKGGGDSDDDPKTKKFKEGDKVEAQYKGKSKFYPGVISRCRLNGTYDIDYDDGEKETGVAAELIRLLGKKGGGDSDDDPKTKKFKEGDKVEAQYKGKSKFYPGVISRCRLNGTYDIDYDDGEKETGVAAELIRLLGKKGGGDSDDDPKTKKFKEGDKVEAQYKGRSKFYPVCKCGCEQEFYLVEG
ncbi:Cytidine deaminase [Phytophthora cinnamomi]|uniref:Cytidine deaminase n=1 Tax=Phytophthora cinnamomi TaxID=4785 RepID=UPI0035593A53|nr:Cytidine deaminase [Phytophthora cinnamomi]